MSDPNPRPPAGGGAPAAEQEVFEPHVCLLAFPRQGSTTPPPSIAQFPIGGPPLPVRPVVVNPYLRRTQPSSTGPKVAGGAISTTPRAVLDCVSWTQEKQNLLLRESGPMGLHSRHRVGAVKASKRFGAGKKKFAKKKVNNRKNYLGGLESAREYAFNPNHHCVVCRATYLGCTKPHRPHHERCHRNKITKGHCPTSIAKVLPAGMVKDNNSSIPMRKSTTCKGTTAWEKLEAIWGRAKMVSLPSNNQPSQMGVSKDPSAAKTKNPKYGVMEESLGHHLTMTWWLPTQLNLGMLSLTIASIFLLI